MASGVTEAECRQAIDEFRAQRAALDRAHGALVRLRADRLAGARPSVWSTSAATAYSARLDALDESLRLATATLDTAIGRVDAAIADVVADIPAGLVPATGGRLS
ncbi:hypothetical protein SAMN04489806_1600 [Paramicrobacterium humi]|uniref:WXG100 family type VII secretion target n=1 Tax=Paramicrobacterium humi TaxID=640635 RepID=A0A1H4LN06_9MICO|nr:hypothetical protein [Microbacterium humi]SEB72008.1 hypothetical protein SAMN04489806_1600 [Microbacterium humi]